MGCLNFMKCEVNESKKQPAYQQAAKSIDSAQKGGILVDPT